MLGCRLVLIYFSLHSFLGLFREFVLYCCGVSLRLYYDIWIVISCFWILYSRCRESCSNFKRNFVLIFEVVPPWVFWFDGRVIVVVL